VTCVFNNVAAHGKIPKALSMAIQKLSKLQAI
jgi:hypothetical protein